MIRRISLLLLLVGLATSVSAQIYSEDYVIDKRGGRGGSSVNMIYGVMVGVTAPMMTDKLDKVDISNKAGYQLGVVFGVDMGGLEIRPEIWWQYDKSDLEVLSSGEYGKLKSNSIEVPIIFGLGFGPINLNVGPSFSLMSDCTFDDQGDTIELGSIKSTVGYVLGLDFRLFDNFVIDARYTGRFISSDSRWIGSLAEADFRSYSYSINVGYRF